MTQLQIFLDIATEAALAAGVVLQGYLGKLEDAIIEKGRPGDLVTAADKASEAVDFRNFASSFSPTFYPR